MDAGMEKGIACVCTELVGVVTTSIHSRHTSSDDLLACLVFNFMLCCMPQSTAGGHTRMLSPSCMHGLIAWLLSSLYAVQWASNMPIRMDTLIRHSNAVPVRQ